MNQPKYTNQQLSLVQELCRMHGLLPDQISFDGAELQPIFDYEAVCALSLKLTDIQVIDCEITDRSEDGISTAKCTVTLPDGRSRVVEDSSEVGENFGFNLRIDSVRAADGLAQNRAVRRGIRSVGVNLYKAHLAYKETGQIAGGHLNHDPRAATYREIHVLASELDLIVDGDKTKYHQYIAENYDGRTSAADLNDIELERMRITFRSLARLQRGKQAA